MRFRMCCWPLAANRSGGSTPRERRLCPLCNAGVEDEPHVLLHCSAYEQARAAVGFVGFSDMVTAMKFDQAKLADLLSAIWQLRNKHTRFPR